MLKLTFTEANSFNSSAVLSAIDKLKPVDNLVAPIERLEFFIYDCGGLVCNFDGAPHRWVTETKTWDDLWA